MKQEYPTHVYDSIKIDYSGTLDVFIKKLQEAGSKFINPFVDIYTNCYGPDDHEDEIHVCGNRPMTKQEMEEEKKRIDERNNKEKIRKQRFEKQQKELEIKRLKELMNKYPDIANEEK